MKANDNNGLVMAAGLTIQEGKQSDPLIMIGFDAGIPTD